MTTIFFLSVGQNEEKLEPSDIAGGMLDGAAVENSLVAPTITEI